MKLKEMLKLEELIMKSHSENILKGYDGSYQIGRYIITPIYWGEDEDGVVIDEQSTVESFESIMNNIDTSFAE